MYCLHNNAAKMQSIKKNHDFKQVCSRGKYVADSMFVAYALANDLHCNRIGITVSKRTSNSAVKRNLIKRWVKESCRMISCTKIGYDFVVIARAPSGLLERESGGFFVVYNSVKFLFKKLEKKL